MWVVTALCLNGCGRTKVFPHYWQAKTYAMVLLLFGYQVVIVEVS